MKRLPSISIIGPGRVGVAIGVLAARAGYPVQAIGGRDMKHARAAAKSIGRGTKAMGVSEAAAADDIVLLTVTDAAIEPLCRRLADEGCFTHGAIVAHCCGAMSSDVLASARELCGCRVASMHPLQTFPTAQAAITSMADTFFFLEGDEPALRPLEGLAAAIGGQCVRIDKAAKPLYHAAACMASNYLVALMDAVLTVEEQVGMDRRTAWVALAPLVEAALNNITKMGPIKALTGPISRGDAETVRMHLKALAGRGELAELYRSLGRWTVDLSLRKGTIDGAAADNLRKVLHARMTASSANPSVIVLAGPNGSGKSTLAPALLRDTLDLTQFVNADTIAQGLAGFDPYSAALEAGRIMLARLHELAEAGQDFAFETTLASRSFAPWLKQLKADGWEIDLVFLWLVDPALAVERVAARVGMGGHEVPENVIRRRYRLGILNFHKLYQPIATRWRVYDNSLATAPQLIARGGETTVLEVVEPKKWNLFRSVK